MVYSCPPKSRMRTIGAQRPSRPKSISTMLDQKIPSTDLLLHIAKALDVPLHGLVAVIELLDDGGTVPFIARYRKEATGNLDEVKVRGIEEKLAYFRELVARRETILASIAEQGKLTDELKSRIEATFDKSELEDLYLPYRPKRRTKATMAREKGLEPLGLYLWAQQATAEPLATFAQSFVNTEKGVNTVEEAIEGARHIVAEMISEDADLRKALRQMMFEEGVVVSHKVADSVDEQEKFKMYYEYREPVKTIPSHRMLAIRRGESEGILNFAIELEPLRAVSMLKALVLRAPGDWTPQLDLAIEDSWERLLDSSIQAEIRMDVKQRSDGDAIQVFRDNLHNLLLAPPAGPISVLGIDPGLRTGCKVAVIDETGKFLGNSGEIKINAITYTEIFISYKDSIGFIGDESYFPQELSLKDIKSVLKDFYPSFKEKKFISMTKDWNLPKDKKISEYSKGMKVKLMFANVLSRDTKLLILDEATNGLDPVVRNDVLKLIQEYIADGEKSVLFSTHILSDLEQIADYIFFINDGKKVLCDSKDEIIEKYVIVKGGRKDITDILKKEMIGIVKTEVGFEGLLESEKAEYLSRYHRETKH